MAPPYAVVMFEGNTLTIYCGSSSQVNWTFHHDYDLNYNATRGFPVSSNHIIGYKNITLVNLQKKNSGDYYCHGMVKNDTLLMSIYVLVMDAPLLGDVIPNWIEVSDGESVTLICGSARPIEWYGVHIHTQNKSVRGNRLTLFNLKRQHSGLYLCWGYAEESLFHSEAKILVDSLVVRISEEDPTFTLHERSHDPFRYI